MYTVLWHTGFAYSYQLMMLDSRRHTQCLDTYLLLHSWPSCTQHTHNTRNKRVQAIKPFRPGVRRIAVTPIYSYRDVALAHRIAFSYQWCASFSFLQRFVGNDVQQLDVTLVFLRWGRAKMKILFATTESFCKKDLPVHEGANRDQFLNPSSFPSVPSHGTDCSPSRTFRDGACFTLSEFLSDIIFCLTNSVWKK